MSKEATESTVETSDKYKIHVKKWSPEKGKEVKANLVLIHGYLEHCGRYYEFGEALAAQGIALTAFDCRGHGKSQGQRAYCWSFSQFQLDLEAALTTIDTKAAPLFLMGHSAGGLVVLDYFLDKKPDIFKGALFSSPFLAPAEAIPSWKIWASYILAWVAPFVSVAAEEVTGDKLTHDKAKQKEHDEDPLNLHNATLGWGYGALKTQAKILASEKKLPVPVLFTFGGADPVADPAANKKFAEELTCPDKTVDERKDMLHEIINETDRKDLFALIAKWILDHAK